MSEQILNNFALKLYNKIRGANKDANFFISPFSISTALSMCYAGAKNETAQQLRDLLHLSNMKDEEILDLNAKYLANINQNLGSNVTIKTANKVYPNAGWEVKKEYLETIKKIFNSEVEQVNFGNSEESAATINKWVAQQTNDKIKDLIASSALNSLTRLVLVNAIYFKGNWLHKFDSVNTTKKDFHCSDGTKKQVDMMNLEGKNFMIVWQPLGLEANCCELPYADDKIALVVILPNEDKTLAEIEEKLTPDIVNEVLNCHQGPLGKVKVNLQLPKFKLEHKTELSDHFKEMGITHPFDQNKADFTGINADPSGLWISKVVHQAVVEVNEEGTEAAAATGVVMMTRMMVLDEPRDFICDRPFMFIIYEKIHNTALFIGKLTKPE